jgi:hypothetical protein
MPPYKVHLVDTPGFDDSTKNDAEILEGIAAFLAKVYNTRGNLSGILYLHQITDARMKGSALKNLAMFQKLVGSRCLKNCVLVTTKWSKIELHEGEAREAELVRDPKFWGNMIANEAIMMRFDGTRYGAWHILQSIAGLSGIVPRLTRQLCVEGMRLKDTDAGYIVRNDLEAVSFRHTCFITISTLLTSHPGPSRKASRDRNC